MRVAVVCFVALVAFGVGCNRPGMVIGRSIPEDWSHKELTEHLAAKGLKARFVVITSGTAFAPPSGFYVFNDRVRDLQDAEAVYKAGGTGVVFCALKKTPQEARDQVGTYEGRGFSNGRFVFGSPDSAALKAIRDCLP